MEYILHLFILISLYTMLSQSLSLSAGFTGMVSLAHAGFYGIGAYTTALLSVNNGFSFWLNLPIAILLSGTIAYLVSFIALRTAEDYFIICTLGIQVIIYSIMNNWMEVTRGPLGIPAIPSISVLEFNLGEKTPFLFLSILLMVFIWYLLNNLSNAGFGKILIAISEDEVFAKSIGKNVHQNKVIAFTISGMLASIPGALYAHYISYIDPTSFTVSESIYILSIVIIGGMTSLKGCFYASSFMVLLPEFLRFIGLPDTIAANFRQIIYGVLMVLLMVPNALNNYINLLKRTLK